MIQKGLDEKEVRLSRERYGSNRLTRARLPGFWAHFAAELRDPIIKILIFALICNALTLFYGGSAAEVAGILFSILAATFVSTVSGYKAERTLDEMERAAGSRPVRVLRGGETVEADPDDLVVGDIVMLGAGERVPADGMLIEGRMALDQSALNGESREKNKTPGRGVYDPADPHALLRGSLVSSGEGLMYVGRVGDGTFYGRVSREMGEDTGAPGPLKERLTRLAKQISRMGYAAAALIAASDFLYSFTLSGLRRAGTGEIISELLHALTLGITVIVVAVPEGLPMMISVVLSANTRRMAKRGVMVRRPVGIETAGNMNVLFCDKTGTLTRGKMRVECFICPDGAEYRSIEALPPAFSGIVSLSVTCNNQATWASGAPSGGNSTDRALLLFAGSRYSAPPCAVRERTPFDSSRKYSSVTLLDGDRTTLLKGAPEVILPLCDMALSPDGGTAALDVRAVQKKISEKSSKAARVIALAYSRGVSTVFLGLCALRDLPRAEAKGAVEALRRAGIEVVMLTGDAPETAAAVARECGIIPPSGEKGLITSAELAAMDDREAAEFLPRLRVLARALPSDKSRLVRLCRAAGLVCGMTGDGTNDAPALKSASVGFAMGSGSETAREAGDVVILDDNVSSIVTAVLYGRTIFHSIRKFITFQLTVNFCAVGISLIAPFIGVDTPVTVTQMLWINVIMDTLAGLAFAGEPPRAEYLREPPRPLGENVINRGAASGIATSAVWTVAASVLFLKSPAVFARFGGHAELMSGFFCFFVFSGLFCAIGARTVRLNLFSRLAANKPFMLIMAGIAAVQILLVRFGGAAFRCVPLTPGQIGFTLLWASSLVPADLIRKIIIRLKPKK